jgi:hypothetical protein
MRDNGAELFGTLMDAIGIDEDSVLVPKIGNGPFLLSRPVSLKTLYRFSVSR